jgi:ubiquinone/menaquinone biosynthesis C-methylase UbiE
MTTTFSEIARRYEQDSVVQKNAADPLFSLLAIGGGDDVLDLGCGAGNLTQKIREFTTGKVVGVDPSEGMLREADAKYGGPAMDFRLADAESLEYREAFDVIFCNSAFQWIREPRRALDNCFAALRKGGRMGIQAPARREYSPNFIAALRAVAEDPRTGPIFSGFRPPWLLLGSAEDYRALFREAGFAVPFARIEEVWMRRTPDQVFSIFGSGAAAGYLNGEYYRNPLEQCYCETFNSLLLDAFRRQAGGEGLVDLAFHRIYLLAFKE